MEFVDIYPTLAELAGLPVPSDLEGTSFKPVLDDPQRAWKRGAISEYPKGGFHGTALRTERYRYVEWRDPAGDLAGRELYDHETDPLENENLSGRPESARVLEQMATLLKGGWKRLRPPGR